jgi:MFS transporter, DHA2 family, multidrug resistance protein
MSQEANKGARLWITIAVMASTLIQVLDTTIVNVALPHMSGELGATSDQITWVLTSYLVASAIFMPLTGYFTDTMGRKKYLLVSITGFVLASALCGIAQNLVEIVLFRLLQGVFGAALVPLSQAIMVDTYPLEERGKAMAIWGLGVMVGPVLGPTLGGWLTDALSWRWTFYVNVPIGALSLLLAARFVPDTEKRARTMDWTGLALLSVGIAGLQYAFDRGNEQDWLAGRDIQVAVALGVLGLFGFIFYSLFKKGNKLFDIRIFKDRNFAMACLIMALLGLGLNGSMVLQPQLLESMLGYPILTTGIVMAPRGIATAIAMIVVGRLVNRYDPRKIVALGMILSAVGSFEMTNYSLDVNNFWIIWPALLQGFGMGLIFVPLSTIAFATLPSRQAPEGAGLYSLIRTIGGAIGISIVETVMSRQAQASWNSMGGYLNPYNPAVSHYLSALHLAPNTPQAAALLGGQLLRQAGMIAMNDAFKLIAISFVVMLPVVLLLRQRRLGAADVHVAIE